MSRNKEWKFAIWSVLLGLLLAALCACDVSDRQQTSPRLPAALAYEGGLTLEFALDKPQYKVGEPITLSLTLRNSGRTPLWVSRPLGLAHAPGAFQFAVFDENGHELPVRIAIVESLGADEEWRHERADLLALVLKTRFLFVPGDFFGLRRELHDAGCEIRTPGVYRLEATYYDVAPIHDDSQLRRLREKAKFPLWAGEIKSGPVYIRVAQ